MGKCWVSSRWGFGLRDERLGFLLEEAMGAGGYSESTPKLRIDLWKAGCQ
ncbi:hypothetical protein MPNT_60075 [Candidatus Methylacidithermus pantelleriae]|uniref:Uncharacterized protein n=1 Tax=Candidatus Methylacidithermus pantelleriae TaxID=2744239 RepID=A0A8J2FX80_9BACT|nr:hypothetical protein MPNT_60075 [Candidatus Methylacidithermus pantelleriae]